MLLNDLFRGKESQRPHKHETPNADTTLSDSFTPRIGKSQTSIAQRQRRGGEHTITSFSQDNTKRGFQFMLGNTVRK